MHSSLPSPQFGSYPKEQFGFFPGRSCHHAQFVLRRLAQLQQCWGGSNKRLWIAFIDFKAAYDHVDREALWHHLQHVISVPPQLLTVIQNMYSGDAYRLVDGLTISVPICPSKGVKQGCPLSPILFALFLSDIGAAFGVRHSTGRMGVPLQHLERGQFRVQHVTHLLFADDLAVVDTSQERLQSQMHSLLRHANDKGLTVNESKCTVLVTGMRGMGGTVQYGNDNMPNVGELCFLGMWMNKSMSMSFASRRMCGSMLAAWRQVLPVAIEHGVRGMLHAMMLLVRTFVLPSALYACQV
jgi:hypothetical protein